MTGTILNALLPILVTMAVGYFAAWRRQFGAQQASTINQMVMQYALPFSLFAGMLQASRTQLIADLPVALVIFTTMVVIFFATLFTALYAAHFDLARSALIALSVGGSSSAFVGTSVLGYFFGPSTTSVLVSSSSIAMQLVQGPVCLVLLSIAGTSARSGSNEPARASQAALSAAAAGHPGAPTEEPPTGVRSASAWSAGSSPPGAGTGVSARHVPSVRISHHVAAALRQPVVWAPLLALVLVLGGVSLATPIARSLAVLGEATAGASLFASGVVLFAYQITASWAIGIMVMVKNLVMPAAAWLVLVLLGASSLSIRESVLTLAIPAASYAVIISLQYKRDVREVSSMFFWSTITSFATMAMFIALT